MSLRHVSLREMGWSRNPTSSGFARRIWNHRVRRRTEHSANTPSLLHRKCFLTADPHSELPGVCATQQVCEKLFRTPFTRNAGSGQGRKKWATKKTKKTWEARPR